MHYLKHASRLLFALLILNISCKNQESDVAVKNKEILEEKHDVNRVEPVNWWVGFKNNSLQLLVHHPEISGFTPSINYAGVSIEKVHKADSPNYLFIDLALDETTQAGKFNITFQQEGKTDLVYTYELKSRTQNAEDFKGFDSGDVMYLITPDRFANGNTQNDTNATLKEKTINRDFDYARHGGDIAGITQHLNYIENMGFTAIWPMPLLTNNMNESSYHGYAITDYYEIDPRYGTLDEYINLSKKASEKGIKLVMDQVVNHCGISHWWMEDLPFKDWINYQEAYESLPAPINEMRTPEGRYDYERINKYFTITNHRKTNNQDFYASKADKEQFSNGWFVPTMPDLNQKNPFMATYLIQNSIWWVETAHLGGIRQDTYPYPDKDFINNWAKAIMTEYPNFNIVGEEWNVNPLLIAYWQEGHKNNDGYESHLKSTMDFAMQSNIVQGLNEQPSWSGGLMRIYEGLALDFAYANPESILAFPDNHDMSRIFTQLQGDIPNTKMALATILTMPRIAQIYYGTEILMNDFEKPGDHGLIRSDFPGGWQGDTVNAFTGEGLTDAQKDMQQFLKRVLNYRKSSNAIQKGSTVHFIPENQVYVIFRIFEDEVVVNILNKNETPVVLDLTRFKELGLQGKTLKNIITNQTTTWDDSLKLSQRGSVLLTTKL